MWLTLTKGCLKSYFCEYEHVAQLERFSWVAGASTLDALRVALLRPPARPGARSCHPYGFFSCRGQPSRFSHFSPLPPAPLAEDISMHMRRV